MVSKFFYLLPEIYEINNGNFIKYLILILVEKIFSFSTKKEIALFLKNMDFPAFLSKLPISNDLMKIAFFLLITDSALQKLPELFIPFLREGIMDFIDKLSLDEEMKNLQVFPLFKQQAKFNPNPFDYKQFKYTYNPNPHKDLDFLKSDFPGLEKPMMFNEGDDALNEDNIYGYKDKQAYDTNQLLQTIQKDSKETEETLKEIEKEMAIQNAEKSKYLEVFQKFKKTKEKIQQTAELLQKTHMKMEATGANPPINKQGLTEAEQNNEKVKEIKAEINKLANRIIAQIKTSKDFNALDISSTNEIMNNLKDIINLLKNGGNAGNEEDFGLKAFQIFINVLEKYKRITLYEMKNSNIVKSLLDFLFDGTLQKVGGNKVEEFFQEEVKMNEDGSEQKNEEIALNGTQISTILKRLFVFVYTFLKKSPSNPQGF